MTIDYTVEGSIATVAFNRPESKNAATLEMRIAIGDIFEKIASDDAIRAVILTGRGGAFCAGADVGAMGKNDPRSARHGMQVSSHRSIRAVHRLEKPVIAAVEGAAAGVGWSYALACDLIVADENAKFLLAQHRVGVAADGGAVWFLSRRIGVGKAKQLVYAARPINAVDAHAIGLVDELAASGQVMQKARALAQEMAEGPTFTIGISKRLFGAANASFDEFMELELMAQSQLQYTKDHTEGVAAFKEKRKPSFVGR